MATITAKDGTQIYYKDWGSGQPVVFSHGWPLSADAFEEPTSFGSSAAALGFTSVCPFRPGIWRRQ